MSTLILSHKEIIEAVRQYYETYRPELCKEFDFQGMVLIRSSIDGNLEIVIQGKK